MIAERMDVGAGPDYLPRMSRGPFGGDKRQRETERARKKQEKAMRRQDRRERGPGEVEVVSAADVQRGLPSVEEAMRAIEQRASAPRAAATVPARLFVGGLSDHVTEPMLRDAFGQFGPVADAIVMVDRESRRPRGFGFVTMADRKDAARAIEGLDGTDFEGKTLAVNVATDRR
jgi:hypothetical protein